MTVERDFHEWFFPSCFAVRLHLWILQADKSFGSSVYQKLLLLVPLQHLNCKSEMIAHVQRAQTEVGPVIYLCEVFLGMLQANRERTKPKKNLYQECSPNQGRGIQLPRLWKAVRSTYPQAQHHSKMCPYVKVLDVAEVTGGVFSFLFCG